MTCKGKCSLYKAIRPMPISKGISRYAAGQKRCQVCEVWMEWDGIRCPCCRSLVSQRPRNSKAKEKYRLNNGRKR